MTKKKRTDIELKKTEKLSSNYIIKESLNNKPEKIVRCYGISQNKNYMFIKNSVDKITQYKITQSAQSGCRYDIVGEGIINLLAKNI